MLRFTTDHEWVKIEGDVALVGISDHAQKALGDITFVELPEIGKSVKKGDQLAVVESVKAASEVYAPISGTVVEINEQLNDAPELVNDAPEGDGWFCKLQGVDLDELEGLLTREQYTEFVK